MQNNHQIVLENEKENVCFVLVRKDNSIKIYVHEHVV